tara:strand:+ start:2408 stop:3238 length:831 start_codon:yes stop_codon:yes gene_type:complete
MYIAFDFGITNTDLIIKNDATDYLTLTSPFDKKNGDFSLSEDKVIQILKDFNIASQDITCIGVTGGKSANLPDKINNIPVIKVNEINAIGEGAKTLYNIQEDSALVVSAGTGTACVHLHQDGSDHLGGISVGGGMLEGLGNIIMNEPSGIILNKYAQNGDRSGLDVMIGEAVNEIGKLNAQITASNFGKSKILVDKSQDNLSAALCNMIGEVIGTVAYLNALLIGTNKAYFLGRTSMLSEVKNGIDERLKLAGVEGIYADNRSFGNAIGVMASIEK